MQTTVNLSVDLDIPVERTWEYALDPLTLCWVASLLIQYFGRPTFPEAWQVGTEVDLQPALWGCKPHTHRLRVVRIDPANRLLQTEESGDYANTWNHIMRIDSLPGGRSRYNDLVKIEAAPHICAFAHLFYRYRQRRWSQIPKGSLAIPTSLE